MDWSINIQQFFKVCLNITEQDNPEVLHDNVNNVEIINGSIAEKFSGRKLGVVEQMPAEFNMTFQFQSAPSDNERGGFIAQFSNILSYGFCSKNNVGAYPSLKTFKDYKYFDLNICIGGKGYKKRVYPYEIEVFANGTWYDFEFVMMRTRSYVKVRVYYYSKTDHGPL